MIARRRLRRLRLRLSEKGNRGGVYDFKESSQRTFNRVCIRRKNFCRFTLWTGLCAFRFRLQSLILSGTLLDVPGERTLFCRLVVDESISTWAILVWRLHCNFRRSNLSRILVLCETCTARLPCTSPSNVYHVLSWARLRISECNDYRILSVGFLFS